MRRGTWRYVYKNTRQDPFLIREDRSEALALWPASVEFYTFLKHLPDEHGMAKCVALNKLFFT